MRRLVLGTAGHVDHGKTTLVRALTGVDTDRLAEEHRRGISIELGFAPLRLADDVELGVVDVPGHERFVRQMVAGAGGMDLAMLVVAADEGPMPQTREHLEVLRALGVRAGLCVLARCDLAGPDITAVVEAELAELVAGSFLEGAPVLRVVAPAGEGLDGLRAVLLELARATPPRGPAGDFRLPVDRSFVLEGTGVVATGTSWQGRVQAGDRLRLLPADLPVRVRELQRHGELAPTAGAGERVALALHGVGRGDVARGDQLVAGTAFAARDRLGVVLEGLRAPGAGLRQGARVHVHHAAREVAGRVELLELDGGPVDRRSELGPGRRALARLRLEAPLVAAPGDRLVLRRWSPMATLAGGVVLEPDEAGALRGRELRERLRVEEHEGPAGWPLRWLGHRGTRGAAREELRARFARQGVGEEDAAARVDAAVASGELLALGDTLLSAPAASRALEEALPLLREHQSREPLSPGLGREELRQSLGLELPPPALERLLQHWARVGPVFVAGDRVRADEPAPGLDPRQEEALARLEREVQAAGHVAQVDQPTWVGPELRLLVQQGRLLKLVPRLVVHPSRLASLREALRQHFAAQDELAVADLKAITGQSRKFVVPLLEHCDAAGWTRFDGGTRRAGPDLH